MRATSRRGTVLFAVLIVITLGALAAATVLLSADSSIAEAEVTLTRAQSRSLAWSGVQVVMSELSSQREALLDGQPPHVTDEWELFVGEGGRRWVVRLIDLGGGGGIPIVSESGRLDLNNATEEMLAALPGVGETLARRIVEARSERSLLSVEDLLAVEGITPELLYGEEDDASYGVPPGDEHRPALADLVTVFSFDPNIQSGVGENAREHRGKRRVNLNQPWSDRLRSAVVDRFGEDVARGMQQIMSSGTSFETEADFVRVLRFFQVAPENWAEALDSLTVSEDEYLLGRVDLNTAPVEVLACVPGLDAMTAEDIVLARERLDESLRATVAWPVVEGLVTPADFERAVPYLTTRSMQWRFRLEAGVAPPEDRVAFSDSASLGQRIVLEGVIDVASQRPRVAYLRDVTLLPLARRLYASRLDAPENGMWGDADDDPLLPEHEETVGLPPLEWEQWARVETPEMAPMTIDPPAGGRGQRSVDGDWYDGGSGAGTAAGLELDAPRASAAPPSDGDTRIGRWTPRRARSR